MSKAKAPCKCVLIIMIDSVIKANKGYYPQTILKECNYIKEKRKIENYINEDLENSESDSDSNNETESDIDNEEKFAKNNTYTILFIIMLTLFCFSIFFLVFF